MTERGRGLPLGLTVVLGLASAGLATVSSAQVWATASTRLPAVREVEARGSDVAPVALPLALVVLASWGALFVLRRRGRRVVAVVGGVAAVLAAAVTVVRRGDAQDVAAHLLSSGEAVTSATTWPLLAALGAAASAALFAVAFISASWWPEMSRKYDSPAAGPGTAAGTAAGEESDPATMWKALDAGHDPTD